MSTVKITHVFFDAAGTLFRVRGSVGKVYGDCAAGFGLKIDSKEINQAFREAFRARQPMAFPGCEEELIPTLERKWWKEVVEQTFFRLGEFSQSEAFFDTLYSVFRTSEAWVLEPGCKDLLTRLKREGRQLGIISNFDSRLSDVVKDLGISSFFDTVTISSRSPAAKPDPRIFASALEQANSAAQSSLHVGNDPEEDFAAARRAGFLALLYDPRDRFFESVPEYRIKTLEEVSAFLT